MASWKKLIVSGSQAELANIDVTNAVTASFFQGDGSNLTNVTVSQVATVEDTFTNVTSKVITHNFNTDNIIVSVYDSAGVMLIPASVTLTNSNTVTIAFDQNTSGHAVVGKGGHIVSGSTGWEYISNIPAGLVSSSLAGTNQGQVRLNGSNVNIATLQESSSPTFAGMTITGDLTVEGDVTTLNTTNLLVEDKFILLNSGSGSPNQGGIIIDEGSGAGHALIYNNTAARFGFTGSLGHSAASATPDAYASAVVDIDAGHTDIPEYQKNGNVKIDSGTIFIYA